MSLLLLFGGGGSLVGPITTPPQPGVGVVTQIPAVAGEWKLSLEIAEPPGTTWYDLTEFYCGDRHQFGANDYKGDARARLVEVQLQIDNVQAAELGVSPDVLAPWGQDTSALFGANVRLGAGLLMRLSLTRVVDSVVVEWWPLWTGRVELWGDAGHARGQIRRHVVSVVDTFSDLANVPTTIPSTAVTWDDYFTMLMQQAGWQFGLDMYGDFSDAGLPQDLNMVAAINRMDQGTDPLGLVWRSRRNGKLVVHPAPWDTTNTERYPNPLLDVYPSGLQFSYSPDFGDIEYLDSDDVEPFGIVRSVAGILNSFVVTMPDDEVYAVDDPVSSGRYGVRPFTATWILSNPPVVDDLLADRAYAESQALPLKTTIDHEGFWPALAMIDHLDPVTIAHMSTPDGLVVTGSGWVRNVIEERSVRAAGLINWQSTIQIDLDSSETSEQLLPVEDLALVVAETPLFGGPSSATFSWTNPTQPSITPTEVQYRITQRSLIWTPKDYPGVGVDGVFVNWLAAETQYTFQVRLVRRVDGIVTAFSQWRALTFTTPATILPVFVPGDDDDTTNGDIPPPDEPCDDFEVELQESDDGFTWVTIDSFTGTELELGDDGVYHLAVDLDNSIFEDDKVYRLRSTCDGVTWVNGPTTDPPDNWSDPCTTPPALSNVPFVDAIVYVPKICAPDIIREAVSGIEAVKGTAFAGMGVLGDDPEYRTLIAIDQPSWDDTAGGIVAFGESPQTVGVTGDKSVSARFSIPDAEDCVLWENCAMRLVCVPTTAGFRVAVVVYLSNGSTVTLPTTSVLAESTEYFIGATFDLETGDVKIYVDGVEDNSVAGTDNVPTIQALPIWRVGAPPGAWITDCATWDRVVTDWNVAAGPTVTINQGASQDDPAFASPIVFDVVFSEAVTGFATGDVTLTGTAGATTGTVVNSGDDIHYTVNVTGMTATGTVTANIPSLVATSIANGRPNSASSSTDNTVTFLAEPPQDDLAGWWDASDLATITESGGFVTQWDDKSGNGLHLVPVGSALGGPATGTRTLNSLNVLDFTNTAGSGTAGNNRVLTVAGSGDNSDYTLFVVNVQDNTSAANSPQVAAFGTVGSGNHGLLIATNSTNRQFLINSGGTGVATGSAITNGVWTLTTSNVTAALAMTIRKDGVADGSGTAAGAPNASPDFAVGGTQVATRAFDGAIAEILLYRPSLDAPDRDDVEAYLMAKWGL